MRFPSVYYLTLDMCEPAKFHLCHDHHSKGELLFIGKGTADLFDKFAQYDYSNLYFEDVSAAQHWIDQIDHQSYSLPSAVILDANVSSDELHALCKMIGNSGRLRTIPFVLLTGQNDFQYKDFISQYAEIDDVICETVNIDYIYKRIDFLAKHKPYLSKDSKQATPPKEHFSRYKLFKRCFDIFFSIIALLLLSPFFLLISLLVILESGWPFFYISRRVGSDYRVFKFYKFRTMRSDADNLREEYKQMNHYHREHESAVFFKVKNDPRVTRIGKFLRKTSLDELPQLINVLKGDMSIVGNRPLPLDEGANLTKDQWASRFLAPAGLTGLWQVSKAKKQEMTVSERIELDLYYAKHRTFWLDLKIICKTLPAMLQKEEM